MDLFLFQSTINMLLHKSRIISWQAAYLMTLHFNKKWNLKLFVFLKYIIACLALLRSGSASKF